MLKRYTSVIFVAAAAFAINGYAESFSADSAEPAAASGPITYAWRGVFTKAPDDTSPRGYWEINVIYPLFASTNPQHEMDALNKQVEVLRESYSCATKGDETFTADVRFISPDLVSLIYEAMWHCPNMASPDSRAGVINFDPVAGKSVTLADQVARDKTEALANLLKHKAEQAFRDGNEACRDNPAFDQFFHDGDKVMLRASKEEHGTEGCLVSLPIEQIYSYLKQRSPLATSSQDLGVD